VEGDEGDRPTGAGGMHGGIEEAVLMKRVVLYSQPG
jgi:hypothetical protein